MLPPPESFCESESSEAIIECFESARAASTGVTAKEYLGVSYTGGGTFKFTWIDFDDNARTNGSISFFVTRPCPEGYGHDYSLGLYACVPYDKEECPTDVSNPISVLSCEKKETETDFQGNGLFPIAFKRYYNGNKNATGNMSTKWTHSYSNTLSGDTNNWINYEWTTTGDVTHTYDDVMDQVYDGNSERNLTMKRPNGKQYNFTNSFDTPTECLNTSLWQARDPGNVGQLKSQDPCDKSSLFEYTATNGNIEIYGTNGQLLSITSPSGIKQTLTYVGDRLSTVTHDMGDTLSFAYDVNGRLSGITAANGYDWGYRYDTIGNLEYVDKPDTVSKRYHYEDTNFPAALTGITDERDIRYSHFEYDTAGKAIASYHGPETSVLTDRIDGVSIQASSTYSILTNSNGGTTTYRSTDYSGYKLLSSVTGVGCPTCGQTGISKTYDPDTLDLTQTNENGLITSYSNYVNGQAQTITKGVGTPEAVTKTYTYNSDNKILTETEPSVHTGSNKVTSYVYDAFGNTTSETITGFQPDGTAVSRTTSYTYNGPLNQLSETNGPGAGDDDITSISYYADDVAEGNNRAKMKSVTAPLGIVLTDNIQWNASGKMASYNKANNLQVSFTYYPGNDRLETVTQTDLNTGETHTTHTSYLATGETSATTVGYGTADATTVSFEYDDARRLTRIYDGLGNYMQYTLDTEGNTINESIYDATDTLHKALAQTFDAYSRLDIATQANESKDKNFAADGTLDTSVDGNDVTTNYSYDALRRLTQINQDTSAINASTQMGYDSQDNLTSVTDPIDGTTTYVYDDLGNLLEQTSPDTGTTTFTHDAAGNVITSLDAKAQLISYSYDALNRLLSTDAPGTDDDFSYSYDNCSNGSGLLCSVTSVSSLVTYGYDAFGNTTAHQAMAYSYDAANRTRTVTYPSGAIITYGYDAAGQIDQVELTRNGSTVTLAGNITYAPFGDINSLSYGNALSLTQSFDLAYRTTSQNVPAAHNLLYSQYDANGNLQQRDDVISSITDTFLFDSLDRLDTANGAFGVRDYDYDKNGNRTQLDDGTVTSYDYDANSNRMNQNGADSVVLDANGNTTSDGDRSYTHNANNRILEVFDSGVLKATYTYNSLGQRISKQYPDGSGTRYIYGLDGTLLAETDLNSIVLKEYIYLNGKLLAVYHADSDADGESNVDEDSAGTNPTSFDSDGDGISDYDEIYVYGTSHLLADSDGDGIDDRLEINLGSDPLNYSITLGDINLNAEVSVGDYLLLTQFVLGTRTATPTEHMQADLNNDGELTLQDMLILQRALLGMGIASVDDFDWTGMFASLWDGLISNAYAALGDGEIYYVHNDHLGTPKAMTNESGVKVWGAVHDPFGLAAVDVGSSVELNVRFPGQYYDVESGMHYNYFRYYDPAAGRYLTSDPIGLDGGLNTYLYALANPIRLIDFFGLNSCGANGGKTYPNKWSGRSIESACKKHDDCYGDCKTSKGKCDSKFYRNIRDVCRGGGSAIACNLASMAYYLAVTVGGRDAFESARKDCPCKK
ncbi:MAG: RHS domain-containing protein [Gammaproteobacteria bacterium]|nr:RHS domain-containing protein [Gammaproteobacteria bacterium]